MPTSRFASRSTAPARHLHTPPFTHTLPGPLYFRAACLAADSSYPQHHHRWGEFVYAFDGVMEVELADRHILVPPQYGLWLPPEVPHRGLNRRAARHASVYVAAEHCTSLPAHVCALTVTPLLRAALEHLEQWPPTGPLQPAQQRLLAVVHDQLAAAGCADSYLPASHDALLHPVLQALQARPGDTRSVAQWAALVHSTERTFTRRCQRALGMTLTAWRERLRTLRAMEALAGGQTVDALAQSLGYASTSAFIAMFRRQTGTTPEAYRRRRRPG